MSHNKLKESIDFAWSHEEISAYHEQYRHLADGDSLLAGVVIRAIARHNLIGRFKSAHIIGAGGVPRGAGLILPTLAQGEESSLVISDSTEENVASTRLIMEQINQNNPLQDHWKVHEQDMAKHDSRWIGAIGRAAAIATFTVFDLLQESEPHDNEESEVGVMEYVAESMRDNNEDYEYALDRFTPPERKLIYMAYSVNSNGYMVGDRHHPAYPVSVDQAAEHIERRGFTLLHDPYEGFAPSAHDFRQEDDPHDFDGFAALVAIRS